MFTQANDSSARTRFKRGAFLMVLMAGALFMN